MANKPAEPAPRETPVEPAAPRNLKKYILFAAAFLLLAGGGFVGVARFAPGLLPGQLDLFGMKADSKPKEKLVHEAHGHIYAMEAQVVNLADRDQQRYLKVKIEMESSEAKPNEEFAKRAPQLKDLSLAVLSSKTYRDLHDAEGKTKLKEELLGKINGQLNAFKINHLYFTEFVIQ
jgi:flagellar protein FliL